MEALFAGFDRLRRIRQALDGALRMVAERRAGVRLAVGASEMPEGLLDLPTDQRFVMRLGRLTWGETWRWVRRNLPGLLRYGEEYLERLWPRLGPELERWEELERKILGYRPEHPDDPTEPKVDALVEEIAPRDASGRTAGDPRRGRPTRAPDLTPRGERPLRVAVAGPHIASADALARAVTRLAADHGLGGRVVTAQGYESGSLAVMIDVPSPFATGDSVSEKTILRWLQHVTDRHPDIILLDYGYAVSLPLPGPDKHERPLLRSLRHQYLMIAAGGNWDRTARGVTAPGVYPEVLAVGPLDDQGALRSYAEWTPSIRQPDLFMRDQLLGTPLQDALTEESIQPADSGYGAGTHGSSFSALHAVAAAILAWSTIPDLTPTELKDLLVRAARPVTPKSSPSPMRLEIADAVAAAREELIRRTLADGPCSIQSLSAITGLDLLVVTATLEALMPETAPEVRRLPRGRLERYELIPRG
jgi:hypothetical protein